MDAKYEQRKKMIYDFMCDDMYVPMKIKELAIVLGVKKDQRPQLEQILNELMTEGRIVCSKREESSANPKRKRSQARSRHIRKDSDLSAWRGKRKISLFRNPRPMVRCIWIR